MAEGFPVCLDFGIVFGVGRIAELDREDDWEVV